MEAEEPMEHSPGNRYDDCSNNDMEPTESVEDNVRISSGPQDISVDGVRSVAYNERQADEGEESMEEGEVDDTDQMPVSSNSLGDPCSVPQDILSPSNDECSMPPYDIPHSTGVECLERNDVQCSPDVDPPHFQEDKPELFSNNLSVNPEEIPHQPASPEDVGLVSEDEGPSSEGICPASPEDETPLSPEDVGLASEDLGPASPEDVGPASPEESPVSPDENPESPDDESPLSPDDEGPASPDYEGPASPEDEGPASPENEDISSEDEEQAFPEDENPDVASPKVDRPSFPEDAASPEDGQVSSEDETPISSVNVRDISSVGCVKTVSVSKTDDADSVAVGESGILLTRHDSSAFCKSAKSLAVQGNSDLSNVDSCSVKQGHESSTLSTDKQKQESDDGSYHSDCGPSSPVSEGDLYDDLSGSPAVNEDIQNSRCVQSASQWPTNIASSPISDTEEIWDDPSMSEVKVSEGQLPDSIENKSDNDDSGSFVKSERRVSFVGDSKLNIRAELISRKVKSTVSQPSLDVSNILLSTSHATNCDSITQKKRKTRKETGSQRRVVLGSTQAAKTDISLSTDSVHSDYHIRHKLDRYSLSKERAARPKEHKRDKDSIYKHGDGLSETVAAAESATPDGGGDEGKMRKEKENTSFNEEHVELDYEEDVADEMHGHHNDISKEDDEDGEGKRDSEDEKQEGEITDDEDDGEIEEEEDCEEGEIREPGFRRQSTKPICRFFLRGSCTWGLNCRFLHPGINDKGNYRLIEMPGFNRVGPMGPFGPIWGPEMAEEPEPPPPPELPPTESAWERGLRHAKELRKKAQEKKEQETDFEEKRLNLTLDEERELNKENERNKFTKDPYYDQPAFEDDEYYSKPQVAAWQPGQYENFEVRWTRGPEYPPFREEERPSFKERHFSLHMDRVERPVYPPRQRHDRRHEKWHHDRAELPPHPPKHLPKGRQADEWHDPWQRTKSPISRYRGSRSDSRGRRRSRRSYSVSSRGSSSSYSTSRSRSSSASSRTSRSSYSRSSSFSSRSPTPPGTTRPGKHPASDVKKVPAQSPRVNTFSTKAGEKKPAPPTKPIAVKPPRPPDKRQPPPTKSNEQPRSAVSLTVKHKQRYPDKPLSTAPPHSPVKQLRPPQTDANNRARRPEKAPPPNKIRTRSGSSTGSSPSRSHSRSSSSSFSRSRSVSSRSSRSSSSGSTSSSGSADSDHLYRDLQKGQNGDQPMKKVPEEKKIHKPPPKEVRRPRGPEHQAEPKQRRAEYRPSRQATESRLYNSAAGYRHQSGRAPATPVKPKDPMKLVGQKQSIKLLLVNKGSEKAPSNMAGLSAGKRRASEQAGPPAKRPSASMPATNKPVAGDKSTKPTSVVRSEKAKSPIMKMKATVAQPKAPLKPPPQTKVPVPTKPAVPAPVPAPAPEKPKIKKSTLSRREELLKQLKAVEDAIARKKSKMT